MVKFPSESKMKTSRLIFCAALMLAIPSVHAETVIYETGFEPADKFQIGALEQSGETWKTSGDYPFEIKDAGSDGKGQIMESASDNAGSGSRAWINGVDFKGSNKVSVALDVRRVRSGALGHQANIHLGNFEDAPKTKPDGTAVLISIRGSGRMIAFDGETEHELKTEVKDGEWLQLRIDADGDAKTFAVSVNGEPVASDLAFRDPQAGWITALGFTHYSGSEAMNSCSMAVDNVKITAP